MSIEDAIRQTIDAGWDALEWHKDIKVDTGDPLDPYVWGSGPKGETGHALPLTWMLLDESFWRALGKA
jgi:hypothetical protein